jgi:hypothetical protein
MANDPIQRHLTGRDEEILLALDRCPLTVLQILKLSRTFHMPPFTSPRSVQDRLQKLREAGWVNKWTYATVGRCGAPDYYKLTPLGYRLLYGHRAAPPAGRHFSEIGIARHHHSHALADFVVHTAVAAHRSAARMVNFARENALRLTVGPEAVFPDCAFDLHASDGRQLSFVVELDNGSERVRSDRDAESWQRKIRLYEHLQDQQHPQRFRVLVVATRSRYRLQNILTLAATLARNPHRSLFCGVLLQDYLAEPNALRHPCFLNHHLAQVPIVPRFHAGQPHARSIPQHTMSSSPSPSATLPPLPPASRVLRRGSSPSDLPSPSS